jgi:hypothetical protein
MKVTGRTLVLRHSFANPMWWGYHFVLVGYHTRYNGVRY